MRLPARPAGKNKTKDAAITSLMESVGFETVPKVGGGKGLWVCVLTGTRSCEVLAMQPNPGARALPFPQGPDFNHMQKMNT